MSVESFEQVVRAVVLARVDPTDGDTVESLSSRLADALRNQVNVSLTDIINELRAEGLLRLTEDEVAQTKPSRQVSGGGLPAALEAGRRFRDRVLGSSEMLSTREVAERLQTTDDELMRQLRAGQLVGLEAATNRVHFPEWQFEPEVKESIAAVLAVLGHLDSWGRYLFFTRNEPLLGGDTPLDALRTGDIEEVLEIAELLAAEARGTAG